MLKRFYRLSELVLISGLCVSLITGCSFLPFGKGDSESVISSEEDDASEESEDPASESEAASDVDSSTDSKEESASEEDSAEVKELSSSELASIEEDLNSTRYNGFTTAEFDSPENIWWDEVFYNGAEIEATEIDHSTVVDEYLKESANEEEELYGDLTYISKADVEKFVQETTGASYSSASHPLNWRYIKKLDLYAFEHGDTNYAPVKCISGTAEGDKLTVEFVSAWYDEGASDFGDATKFKLIMYKTDSGYRFVSNEWDPGRDKAEAVSEMYDDIIKRYAKAVSEYQDADTLRSNNCSTLCADVYTAKGFHDDPADVLGYYLTDIDHDGIDELFIGANKRGYVDAVYDAFTIHKGTWTRICMSDFNNKYYLMPDGSFYEEQLSNGGRDSVTHLEMQGSYKFLTPIDGVAHYVENDTDYWIYSDDGYSWDYNSKQITEEEYSYYYRKANLAYMKIRFTPFSSRQ